MLTKPSQEELNEAMRQLRSNAPNARAFRNGSVPSNNLRNVRAHIPFSQEVMRNASREEAKGSKTSSSYVVSRTRRKYLRTRASKMDSGELVGKAPMSGLEKAMMWR